VLHAKALYGNPFDGQVLGPVTAQIRPKMKCRAASEPSRRSSAI
jgi:hypothetical protein